MPDQDELETQRVRLKSNGDIVHGSGTNEILVAHYDRTSGRLEFTTRKHSIDFYTQCTSRIGSTNKGTESSNLVIRSVGVKGEPVADLKKIPKRPQMGPHGDAGEETVAWFLEYNLPEAIVRYGIYTDADGRPIKRRVKRLVVETVDLRASHEDKHLEWHNVGEGQEKAPVMNEGYYIEKDSAIIARRATPLTFMPQEVVGGWKPAEDWEETTVGGEA